MRSRDAGLSEVVAHALLAILVIAFAGIAGAMFFGLIDNLFPKSAYVAVGINVTNDSGNYYLEVSHRAGDVVYLNGSSVHEGLPVDFRITAPSGGSGIAEPVMPLVWRPGETFYVYAVPGGYRATADPAAAAAGTGLPEGEWQFDVVDLTQHVIVFSTRIGIGRQTPAPTSTATGTTTVTVSPTTVNTTPGTTTTSPTVVPTGDSTTTVTTTTAVPCSCSIDARDIGALNVQFKPNSTYPPTACFWTFGDGASSSKCDVVHKYGAAGTYNAGLSVTSSCGVCLSSKTVTAS